MDACEENVQKGCGGDNNYESDGSEWTEEGNENVPDREELVIEEDCTDHSEVVGLTSARIMRKRFRSEDAAYEFYKRFGKCHGFGIRKGDFGKDDAGRVIRRRLFYNRAGLRDPKHYNRVDRRRVHKPETRTNCGAKLSIYLEVETSLWRVRKVVMENNHELTPAAMIYMIPTFRSMSEGAKVQMDGMQGNGVATSKILWYMAGQAGGYSFVGFTKKDAYNYVEKSKSARIVDGDANAAIGYLEERVNSDQMSIARYLLTEDKMLAYIFWADGGSRIDYQYFGDVLAFNSTYKKNKYKRPLVIFSGSNNHKQTTIFGFGLLLDETVASYKWLLENFLEAMCQKKPSVVVTDGDEAMRAAIRVVLPDVTHRLCAWHLEKNVTTNVRWEGLRSKFNKWLYAEMKVEESEEEWQDAMVQYGTGERFWFQETYEKRRMWANAYLRDKFCASFRTTSRCEGINAYVKKFVKLRHSLLEMLQGLELMVREYCNNELEAQFKLVHGFPILTTGLEPLERHAAKVYTWEIFFDVRKEVEGVMEVNFVAKVKKLTTMVYTVEGYTNPGRHIVVLFERNCHRL